MIENSKCSSCFWTWIYKYTRTHVQIQTYRGTRSSNVLNPRPVTLVTCSVRWYESRIQKFFTPFSATGTVHEDVFRFPCFRLCSRSHDARATLHPTLAPFPSSPLYTSWSWFASLSYTSSRRGVLRGTFVRDDANSCPTSTKKWRKSRPSIRKDTYVISLSQTIPRGEEIRRLALYLSSTLH